MTTFVLDTFTGPDGTVLSAHVGEVGATWAKHPSYGADTMELESNKVRVSGSTAPTLYYASGVPPSAEYAVQGTVSELTDENGTMGVAGRISLAANTLYTARYESNLERWELYKFVAGAATLLGNYVGDDPGTGPKVVRLVLRDALKEVYVEGVQRITSTDNVITAAGLAGARGGLGTTGPTVNLRLDAFSAFDFAAEMLYETMDRRSRATSW